MPKARSPTARHRMRIYLHRPLATGSRYAYPTARRRIEICLHDHAPLTAIFHTATMRSRRLRLQHIPIRRSRVGKRGLIKPYGESEIRPYHISAPDGRYSPFITGESPTRQLSEGPTLPHSAPPNGDMPKARSPTARHRMEIYLPDRNPPIRRRMRIYLPDHSPPIRHRIEICLHDHAPLTAIFHTATMRSRRLRFQHIPIRRSRVGQRGLIKPYGESEIRPYHISAPDGRYSPPITGESPTRQLSEGPDSTPLGCAEWGYA